MGSISEGQQQQQQSNSISVATAATAVGNKSGGGAGAGIIPPSPRKQKIRTFAGSVVPGLFPEPPPFESAPPSRVQLLLGWEEIGCRETLGASITEANATMLFMYGHIGIVRAATSGCDIGECVYPSSPAMVAAIGHFFLVTLLTYAFASSSGAHFNPNTTLATTLIGYTSVYRFICYLIFQIIGGILGVMAMRLTLGWDEVDLPSDLAPCGIGSSVSPGGAVVANGIFYHTLLCVIGGIAFDPQNAKVFGAVLAPIFIGATVGMIILASSSLGDGFGPMLNFAECISVSIVSGTFNGQEWISFVGPALGAILHAILHVTFPPGHSREDFDGYEAPLLKPWYQYQRLHKYSQGNNSNNNNGSRGDSKSNINSNIDNGEKQR